MPRKRKLTSGFIAIIVFKYFKAAIFLLAAIAIFRISRADPFPTAEDIARFFGASPENEIISRITPRLAIGIGFASLFVGCVFGIEATLLAFRVWWSTYFTITLTALGIPLELYEIYHRPHGPGRYIILAVNAAILVYLWRRRNEFREDFSGTRSFAPSRRSG
jgi:predicted branched-subunit amino acid permease